MVHIYVSLDKLAQKLTQVGLLKGGYEFRAFAQSFSVNQPLFSIIDVGQGKERADYRIKEMLRTFSDNPTCKHIIFGGCHDQGYLLNLDQYKHDQRKAERITLLETTASARGFAELPNFKKTRFDSVFRYDPLPEHQYNSPVQAQVQAQVLAQAPAPIVSPPPGLPVRQMSKSNAVAPPAPLIENNPAVTASPTVTASKLVAQSTGSSAAADASWATVGKTGAGNGTISIASNNSNKKKKYIYYNEEGHRLDEPLPPRDRNAADAIDKRRDKAGRNFCNNWHLSNGKCNNGDFCNFQHAPKLNAGELNALRYKARSIPCKRVDCENFDCYLGHQCSFERDQGYCPFPDNCKLKETHGMDKTKYVRYDEDGNEEYARPK
ncbi:hypothetical protein BDV96DRAFT_487270 [Lophiotrema nucula]|uniref:C3H1-type domain-containing protein n=1 Tax=Lophiotrema nucula TaxID=690887 RepID=A0A6A5ZGS0_9PLEO|nr:hypothetical protein BDV96DRAFT_487270 [Lophiotrema nucula]